MVDSAVLAQACTWCLIAHLEGERSWETLGEKANRIRVTNTISRYLHGVEFGAFQTEQQSDPCYARARIQLFLPWCSRSAAHNHRQSSSKSSRS